MADYKTIHGTTVKNYTADPDNPIEGQVWYDETAATLQYQIPNVTSSGSFRTGNAMKWKIKRVSKRVCQMDQLSNQFIGLEYQVRNGKVLSKNELIGKRHQLIIKRTFLYKP